MALGAVVSALSGNDAVSGALAAGGAEALVPLFSKAIYDTKDPEKLTAEQIEIVSEIDDELAFATIEVSENNIDDVFRLGYRLAVFENDLRDKGEFDF